MQDAERIHEVMWDDGDKDWLRDKLKEPSVPKASDKRTGKSIIMSDALNAHTARVTSERSLRSAHDHQARNRQDPQPPAQPWSTRHALQPWLKLEAAHDGVHSDLWLETLLISRSASS